MPSCSTCGNHSWLCQRCKLEDLENRHGTPTDQVLERWVLRDDLWHAGTEFNGQTHSTVCGVDVETPLEWSTEDLRYVPDQHTAPVCRECVAGLEAARTETIPEDAIFERASELRADGGKAENEVLSRAVREATTLVEAGDSIDIAVGYVVDVHDLGHRRDDVLERVRDQRDEQLVTDGGRDQDDTEFYVVDEDHGAVVAGPIHSKERAAEDARDRGPSHIVATEGVLEMIALTSNTTLRWEINDVDVVTDGGRNLERQGRDAFLAGDTHWCDICSRPFDRIDELANHDCRPVRTDGGRDQDRDPGSIQNRLSEIDKQTEIIEENLGDVDVDPVTRNAILGFLKGIGRNVEGIEELLDHFATSGSGGDDDDDDGSPIPIPDGGRPQHRANCEDCAWSFADEDLVDVSDEMERHARKEMHDVDLERAVATDGGVDQSSSGTEREVSEWECPSCGGTILSAVMPLGCTCGAIDVFREVETESGR